MKIERQWAMPNKWTFRIKPIKELLMQEKRMGCGLTHTRESVALQR